MLSTVHNCFLLSVIFMCSFPPELPNSNFYALFCVQTIAPLMIITIQKAGGVMSIYLTGIKLYTV